MKVEKRDTHTTILLNREELLTLCRPGAGADTCIWAVVGEEGFECLFYNRHEGVNLEGETLHERWLAGKTVAKRDGCDEVRALDIHSTSKNGG